MPVIMGQALWGCPESKSTYNLPTKSSKVGLCVRMRRLWGEVSVVGCSVLLWVEGSGGFCYQSHEALNPKELSNRLRKHGSLK